MQLTQTYLEDYGLDGRHLYKISHYENKILQLSKACHLHLLIFHIFLESYKI